MPVYNKTHAIVFSNRFVLGWKRRQRVQRLRARMSEQEQVRLIVGASGTQQDGWLATEEDELDLVDRKSWQRLMGTRKITAINAEHVWEHLTEAEAIEAAKNCFEFLSPGGHVRCAVPDGLHSSQRYIDWVRPGGNGPGCDDHYMLYDHESLSKIFSQAGFDVKKLEFYDRDGEFHAEDWDPSDGMISRSIRFDPQDYDSMFVYTSLIIDAVKPHESQRAAS